MEKYPINKRIYAVFEFLQQKRKVKNEFDFATKMKYSHTAIGNVFKHKVNVSNNIIESVVDVYGVNKEYLTEGKEPMFTNNTKQTKSGIYIPDNEIKNCFMIPAKVVGGFVRGYESRVFMNSIEKTHFPLIKGECFMFEVEGFSMYKSKIIDGQLFETGYKPGTHIITTRANKDELRKGKEYVFQTVDGLPFKIFTKMDDKYCYMESINEEYNPVTPISWKDIKGLFFKEYKID